MVHDPDLAARLRKALGTRPALSEKRMMGGLIFMLHGNMVAGAHRDKATGEGFYMFRVGKDADAATCDRPEAIPMQQGGRRMNGFFLVREEDCGDPVMDEWLDLALAFNRTLPPKDEG